jgi:hypothetical protein
LTDRKIARLKHLLLAYSRIDQGKITSKRTAKMLEILAAETLHRPRRDLGVLQPPYTGDPQNSHPRGFQNYSIVKELFAVRFRPADFTRLSSIVKGLFVATLGSHRVCGTLLRPTR